tara:strand:- start:2029 stop:2421 length:393 start_codon:yes stop_codon:yes gene_type:complete
MTIRGHSAAELMRLVREVAGPALDELEEDMRAFKTSEIDPVWPIATGTSLAAWSLEGFSDPRRPSVGVSLTNSAGYAQYIKSSRVGRRLQRGKWRHAMTATRKALRARKRQTIKRVHATLAKHLDESFGG